MATGLFFKNGDVIWVDIFVVAKNPVVRLGVPIVREGPMRRAHFPCPDPVAIDMPLVTTLEPLTSSRALSLA